MKTLSVVLATRNEEVNIATCLASVKDIADEIIVFDEHSTDKTREIARSFGAKVYEVEHEAIFHITKQKAINKAISDWILQLDADEILSPELVQEIQVVLDLTDKEILERRPPNKRLFNLFLRHQSAVERRDGNLGKQTGEVVAFFLPRRNLFIGEPLIHAGVYPDGVIRLIKQGKAHLPAKSVHEQMVIEGEVAWLFSDLIHNDSPTLMKYLQRMNRYTDLRAADLLRAATPKSLFLLFRNTFLDLPLQFGLRYYRRRGYKDGIRGFLWSLFSAWQYPLSYYKYYFS
jgi:glycosyltransferase involved in cell wall biosynthesis